MKTVFEAGNVNHSHSSQQQNVKYAFNIKYKVIHSNFKIKSQQKTTAKLLSFGHFHSTNIQQRHSGLFSEFHCLMTFRIELNFRSFNKREEVETLGDQENESGYYLRNLSLVLM